MIRSGTDETLALGLRHVLIHEDLLDHDSIARATLGFETLRENVRGYPPERVAVPGILARSCYVAGLGTGAAALGPLVSGS